MSAMVPASMTVETFAPIFEEHLRKVESVLGGIFAQAARDTPDRSAEEKEAYMQYLVGRPDNSEAMTRAASEGLGVPPELFQACLMKFGGRKQISEAMERSHARQEAMHRKFLDGAA
jgi:hypothetical protein